MNNNRHRSSLLGALKIQHNVLSSPHNREPVYKTFRGEYTLRPSISPTHAPIDPPKNIQPNPYRQENHAPK